MHTNMNTVVWNVEVIVLEDKRINAPVFSVALHVYLTMLNMYRHKQNLRNLHVFTALTIGHKP